MIEKKRRDKLINLAAQAETIIENTETDQPDFQTAALICRTICDDIREACRISEKSEEILAEKLGRIRRVYESGN